MAKDIVTKAEILGGEIDVRANFGQTVKVTVSPDPYMGDTEVTPSAETQVLATKKKFVQDDITVLPAPVEGLLATSNGTFTPSDGKVGFSEVDVNVVPDLRPLSVSENGQYSPDGFDGYSSVTADIEPNLTSLAVTENGLYLPESGTDGFDRVNVDVPQPSGSIEINQNGTYDVTEFASAVVDVPQKITADDVANATISGDITLTATTITRAYSFARMPITSIDAPNLVTIQALSTVGGARGGLFLQCNQLTRVNTPNLKDVPLETFMNCSALTDISFANIETLGNNAFNGCASLSGELLLPKIKTVGNSVFRGAKFTAVKFGAKPTMGSNVFQNCTLLTDIYVPWSEGEVSDAPWGATSATIHRQQSITTLFMTVSGM